MHGSGNTTLIISNEEINDLMKIVQALEYFNILLKGVTKTIEKWNKRAKRRIFKYVIWASLLGKLLAGKGIVRARSGNKK